MAKLITKESKAEEYKSYIKEHVDNVKKAWKNMINKKECMDIILKYDTEFIIEFVTAFIENHDQSKYSIEEFEPYRKRFFPIDEEEKNSCEEEFRKAWQHHKDYNPHHWNHWDERGLNDVMPSYCVLEMACDHIAMSDKFGGTALNWYKGEKEKGEIRLGKKQEEYYLSLLEAYYR